MEANRVLQLLDLVKLSKGIKSNYALAKVLGVNTSTVSNYYKNKTMPDDGACLRIADALCMPAPVVLTFVAAERNLGGPAGEQWSLIAQIVATTLVVVEGEERP